MSNLSSLSVFILICIQVIGTVSSEEEIISRKRNFADISGKNISGRVLETSVIKNLKDKVKSLENVTLRKVSIEDITKILREKCTHTTNMSFMCKNLRLQWGSKLPDYIKNEVLNNTDNSKIFQLIRNGDLSNPSNTTKLQQFEEMKRDVINCTSNDTNHRIETNIPQPEIMDEADTGEVSKHTDTSEINDYGEAKETSSEDFIDYEGSEESSIKIRRQDYTDTKESSYLNFEDQNANQGNNNQWPNDALYQCDKFANISVKCSGIDGVMSDVAEWLVDLTGSYFRTSPEDIELPSLSTIAATVKEALRSGTHSKSIKAQQARGKLKKLFNNVSLLVMFKAAAIGAIALGAIKLLAGKALLVGSLALALAAMIGFKKLSGGAEKAVVVHRVAGGHGHNSGWNEPYVHHGHDSWDPHRRHYHKREDFHNDPYISYYKPDYEYELDKGAVTSYYYPQTIS